jgi:hypothetical protein
MSSVQTPSIIDTRRDQMFPTLDIGPSHDHRAACSGF